MTTPFRTREAAIRAAHAMAQAIRRHGQCADVIVECISAGDVAQPGNGFRLGVATMLVQPNVSGAP